MNNENIWDTLVPVLQARVDRVRFYTWFKDLSFVSDDGATLRLRGPNGLYCDFFQHRFAPIVHEVLAEFGRAGTNLVVRPD
ncbi:MAG: hypothetical protein A3H96_05555 [Acidobacteria bacterium RIFCSPLOWO2_02_FULL_67_36]|nr:MAG: hypothetical protein A3H96_05555 [Acidobacteria bacterium RIFCSPLOWO2_02_FULL_67_36]OFW21706.1 MAG: hypothetical protein A3G21_15040 [Acidobacteria bacterium RIFCSPLOWO2_12_FULL_66_21]